MPAGIVMRPLRLDLGQGETGIGNELWALAGYLLLAFTRNHTLCLPPFTTNVHTKAGQCDSTVSAYQRARGNPCTRTKPLPFADVFDAEAFIAGMSRVGVRCSPPKRAMMSRRPTQADGASTRESSPPSVRNAQ